MAVEVAMEDDVFFADLNRQISLLIDDDGDDIDHDPLSHFPSVSPQIYSQSRVNIHPTMMMGGPQYIYQENCTSEYLINSKGTGVFIPQRPQLRRNKHRDHRRRPKSNNNNKGAQVAPPRSS